MRWWFGNRVRRRLPARSFAALQAMPAADRRAALAGPDRDDWLRAAAEYGLVEAQLLLGQSLLDRNRPALAICWFRAAADAGHAPAQNMLGRCLELGRGTAADPVAAAAQYRRAAEAGLDWAQFNLGMLLLYGLGVRQDRAAAFGWFERAAAQNHAKAANMMGRCLEEGWARPRDADAAASCYRRAAAGGDFRGQFNLGTLLFASGRREEAVRLIREAWRAGTADFLAEAGAALRGTGDPELMAIAATA